MNPEIINEIVSDLPVAGDKLIDFRNGSSLDLEDGLLYAKDIHLKKVRQSAASPNSAPHMR